jgi:hypothetical protein
LNRASQLLADALASFLEQRGFKFRKALDAFVKRERFGFSKLSLPSFSMGGNSDGWYEINIGLAVRHDAVDRVVNTLGHIWGEANQKGTSTVYRGLQFFPFAGHPGSFQIASNAVDRDVKKAKAEIEAMLSAGGFKFFEEYSSVLRCSIGLNDPIETRTHPLCNSFPLRAYYGVAAAGLSQPERVPELIRKYAEFAEAEGMVDSAVYDVGRELTGLEAINVRFHAVASRAKEQLTI